MGQLRDAVGDFLKQHGMDADCYDFEKMLNAFADDMACGLSGNVKSLLMIPAYIDVKGKVPYGMPVIALDAGGTNFRVASVTFRENSPPLIENYQKYPMPGTRGRISRDELLDTVVNHLIPVMEKSSPVGFCFSFPTEILPNLDGRLLGFNKEVAVDDSAGMLVGESLNQGKRQETGHMVNGRQR